jgi:hypothetical protein
MSPLPPPLHLYTNMELVLSQTQMICLMTLWLQVRALPDAALPAHSPLFTRVSGDSGGSAPPSPRLPVTLDVAAFVTVQTRLELRCNAADPQRLTSFSLLALAHRLQAEGGCCKRGSHLLLRCRHHRCHQRRNFPLLRICCHHLPLRPFAG